jgi:hypothetical protein
MSGFDRVRRVYGRQHRVPTRHLGIISFHRVAEYNERLSSSVFSLFEVHFLLTGHAKALSRLRLSVLRPDVLVITHS